MNTFLPQGYEPPKASSSRFTRFEIGDTRIRILSNSIVGWQYFNNDNKPIRSREVFKSITDMQKDGKQKEFWAFIVYNYKTEQIEIVEITQVGIKKAILDLYRDEEYGDPKHYDLKIKREGDSLENTKYSLIPGHISEVSPNIQDLYDQEKANICLEAIYDGGDPFKGKQELEGDVFK